jgi:hypothetical protein
VRCGHEQMHLKEGRDFFRDSECTVRVLRVYSECTVRVLRMYSECTVRVLRVSIRPKEKLLEAELVTFFLGYYYYYYPCYHLYAAYLQLRT